VAAFVSFDVPPSRS